MAQTKSNVTYAKPETGGAIYYAPLGTTLPTDTTTDLGEAFTSLGYVSEDGLVNACGPSDDGIIAWGGDRVLSVDEGDSDTFQFTLLEVLNPDVLKFVHGSGNVTGTLAAGIAVAVNNDARENMVFVIDMIMRGGVAKRICVPSATITEVGEVTYKHDEAVGYNVTISALKDNDGNSHYEYIKGASEGNG